jgi:cation diffusion facilitator family transporter
MNLSLGIGFLMLFLKVGAYLLTHSAAILSDAAESVVHAVAVCFAAYSLRLSYRPSDEHHPYGHAKIGFFSAGFEGGMITLAAFFILLESAKKWAHGADVENAVLGTTLTAASILINGGLGAMLIRLGKKRNSLILVANGHHTFTDVWTSVGVVVALGLTLLTGGKFWDPLCGIAVGINILVTGYKLIRESYSGLMDRPQKETVNQIRQALQAACESRKVAFHGLRVRPMGDRHAAEYHLELPKETPLGVAHQIATEIEHLLRVSATPAPYVISHLEAAGDHADDHDIF